MNTDDLSIFNVNDDIINDCNGSHFTKCVSMRRLLKALEYRALYKIMQNENDEEIFRNFMNVVYLHFIDDYHHFQMCHCDELEEIHKYLKENEIFNQCNLNKCDYTARHYRAETEGNDDGNTVSFDADLNVYIEMMDALHFHLLHSFEAGLRCTKSENDEKKAEFDEEKSKQHFDAAFARLNERISTRAHLTASFERFSTKNAKYNISIGHENKTKKAYLERVIVYLITQNVDINDIKTLRQYLEDEEYDSVSMKYDEGLHNNGNIANNIENKTCLNVYVGIIRNSKLSASSFAVGFRTYYWSYYKDIEQLGAKTEQYGCNINDHSGFKVKELFVSAKYGSFKIEISNYKYIQLKQYEENVLVKAKKLIHSQRIKKTTATGWSTRFLYYDINRGDAIGIEHLSALLLYTDWTDLCSAFSGSFRKKSVFESIQSLIKRNSEYYWMSRHLRECVEIFGQCSRGLDKRYGDHSELTGPYYSGMNMVMNIPTFNIRLCSPSSTSKQIAIAMRFGGTDGIILQLDNPNTMQYCFLHGFNASFFSRYAEEDERLFFGGFWFIKLESIRITSTKQNFEEFIALLHYVDLMVTGGQCNKTKLNNTGVFIIESLFDNVVNKNDNKEPIKQRKTIDAYIYETFDAFVLNKKHIILDLNRLTRADNTMRDLLMNMVDRRQHTEEKHREDTDLRNLFKEQLFDVFINIQTLTIGSTDSVGSYSYSLSMIGLLSLIEIGSVEKVVVKAKSCDDGSNWIKNVWDSSSEILTKMYEEKNYNILMKPAKINDFGDGYLFGINKRS